MCQDLLLKLKFHKMELLFHDNGTTANIADMTQLYSLWCLVKHSPRWAVWSFTDASILLKNPLRLEVVSHLIVWNGAILTQPSLSVCFSFLPLSLMVGGDSFLPVWDESACGDWWTNGASPWFVRTVNLCQEGRAALTVAREKGGRDKWTQIEE